MLSLELELLPVRDNDARVGIICALEAIQAFAQTVLRWRHINTQMDKNLDAIHKLVNAVQSGTLLIFDFFIFCSKESV